MGLIFLGSSDRASWNRSSRRVEKFVRWLMPGASPNTIRKTVVVVRKSAHVGEYAILTVLIWCALRSSTAHRRPRANPADQTAGPATPAADPSWANGHSNTAPALQTQTHLSSTPAISPAPSRAAFPWRTALITLAAVLLYAITDELHQTFVPARQGSPWDVCIDSLGAVLALTSIWLAGRSRRHW